MQHICSSSFCSKYVDDNFYCNYAAGSLCCNYIGGTFCSALCTWHWQPLFIKLIRKHLKAFVNISRKLIYFEGRNDIQISYKSYSVLSFSRETYERQGHVGFLERGNLRKWGKGWSREGGGVWPPLPTMTDGNDKNNVIVNYLFIKLVFVLKLLGLNGYLKGYLKSRINKLLRKNNFLLEDADSLKISVFCLFWYNIFTEAHCVIIETMSSNEM